MIKKRINRRKNSHLKFNILTPLFLTILTDEKFVLERRFLRKRNLKRFSIFRENFPASFLLSTRESVHSVK
jgi:hypothetical protein